MDAEGPIFSMGEVFVVDDDHEVRAATTRLIASAGYRVRAYASAHEFLEAWAGDEPSCLVLDLMLPDVDGMTLHHRLADTETVVQVIFVTGFGDIPTSVEAIRSGAFDFLSKPVDEGQLLESVGAALEAARKAHAALEERRDLARRYDSLTRREREVVELIVMGRRNKQIARELRISEKTVKVHRGRAMGKMGVGRVAGLVQSAVLLGLPSVSASPAAAGAGLPDPGARNPGRS